MVGNSLFQKMANRSLILNYLYYYGPVSRKGLAKELGLQASTVTNITREFMKESRIIEHGVTDPPPSTDFNKSRGSGRKPVEIGLSPAHGCVIGLDLQVDYYVTVIYDYAGNQIASGKKCYEKRETNFLILLKSTVYEISLSIKSPILGMGLALPGIINSPGGIIMDCWTHNLRDEDLSSWLNSAFTFPVIMENDANCAALTILQQMRAKRKGTGDTSFIYLLPRFHNPALVPETQPSVGIGMGLVIGGTLYRGENFRAGEYQSILAFQSSSQSRQLSLSDEKLKAAYEDENIQKEIITELMHSMKLLLQILDPRYLFMGGDLSGRDDLIKTILMGDNHNENYTIDVREKDSFDSAEGAAFLVFEKIFAIPQIGTKGI